MFQFVSMLPHYSEDLIRYTKVGYEVQQFNNNFLLGNNILY